MAPKTTRRDATRSERRRAAVHRRRQLAATRTVAARRATRRKRRSLALAVFAGLAVVGGTVGYLTLRPEAEVSKQLRAEPVPGTAGPLGITATPASYRAVYRAESFQGSEATSTTEEILIRRPFDARVQIREG